MALTNLILLRARYFLFPDGGFAAVFPDAAPPKGDAGTTGFFGCFCFLASRLLRSWPLAIGIPQIKRVKARYLLLLSDTAPLFNS
jgi:hypothetical protein